MKPKFFSTPLEFRKWLEKNHDKKTELIVGFYKVNSGLPSQTWSESVDQALCFGWIDGIRRSIDEKSYCIRFTPRKPSSNWSEINIEKIKQLKKAGQMMPAGLDAFKNRSEARSGIYAYEKENTAFAPAYEKLFRKNKKAWDFFNRQAPSYRKVMTHWIMNAKQESTRMARLLKTIGASEAQKRVQ